MATGTGGTNASTSLTSLQMTGAMAAADIATIANAIFDDRMNLYPNPTIPSGAVLTQPATPSILPGAFAQNGQLFIPNRGVLRVFPGDYVMVDTVSGWPILVSRTAIGIAGTVWNP